jgi:HAD superfamily hydrolase (TIGR01459 family)
MSELAALYDGFVLDQWGVLHDGTTPYEGAAECLTRLRAAGKRIVILSNSGKREADNLALMARMGFDTTLLDRFVSAGEDARIALAARTDAFHRTLGRRCYTFTRGGDRTLLEGIGLEFTDAIDDAEFLAVIGTDSPRRNVADYESELGTALARRLPMICANPDVMRLTPEGVIEAPGALAQRYEALGGSVFYHGKPYPAIYDMCLSALGCPRDKVVAVGDSLDHDVLGARRVGIASALIPGGVHAAELDITWGALPHADRWDRYARTAPVQPDYLLAGFNW